MKQLSHNQLQSQAFLWAHNNYPTIRGKLFAVLNEIHPHPGESKEAFRIRLNQLKAIGLQSGVLDLMWIAPGRIRSLGHLGDVLPATYAFDAKVGTDHLSESQLKFIANLQKCGGNGWEFRSLEQFQSLFTPLYLKHYGT